MITLIPKLLTSQSFAPFGDVISKQAAKKHFTINNGNTERYHDLANVDVRDGENGHAIINIFHAQPLSYPLHVKMVERHPLGSQAFIPIGNQPFFLIVGRAGDDIAPEELHAFVTDGSQGINYHKAVWHHPIMAIEKACDFLVIDRGGNGDNCEEHFFNDVEIFFKNTLPRQNSEKTS